MSDPQELPSRPQAEPTAADTDTANNQKPSPSSKTPPMAAIGVGGLIVGLLVGGIGGLAIGSSNDELTPAANTQASSATTQGDSTSTSTTADTAERSRDFPGKNMPVEASGVTMTVTSVEEASQERIREDGVRADVAEILTTDAAPGQKFVTITTEVTNTGKMPWDLTCGAAVQATLFDLEERQFAAVDELYRVPGNPECNANTQPGQTVPMTWRYEVPESVVPKYLGFREFGFDFQSDSTLTAIDLDR